VVRKSVTEKNDIELGKVNIFDLWTGCPIFIVCSSNWNDSSRLSVEIKSCLPRERGGQRIFEIKSTGGRCLTEKFNECRISLIFRRLQDIVEIPGQSCSAFGDEGIIDPCGGYKSGRKQTFGRQRKLIIKGLMKGNKLSE